jgi:hypothetical protein
MGTSSIACSIGFVLASAATAFGQQLPNTPADLTQATSAQKKAALVQIIRHELAANPESVTAMISAGFADDDPKIRETALAAVVSRAAGPRFAPNGPAANDWLPDRERIQGHDRK